MVLPLEPHLAHKKSEVADLFQGEALYLNVPKRTHSVPTGDLSLHVHSLVLKVPKVEGNGFQATIVNADHTNVLLGQLHQAIYPSRS